MLKKISLLIPQIQLLLLAAWILTGPMNLFYKLLPNYGFVGGLQIDYLIPKLYLADIVGFGVLVTSLGNPRLWKWISQKRSRSFYAVAVISCVSLFAFFFRQLYTPLPWSSFWFFCSSMLHAVIPYIFYRTYQLLTTTKKKQWRAVFLVSLVCITLFQMSIGIYQFVNQRELIGYRFFGEPELRRNVSLSKASFAWVDDVVGSSLGYRILPYGTTAHSNILAGLVVIGIFCHALLSKEFLTTFQYKFTTGVYLLFCFLFLLLTLSFSALLTGVVAATLLWTLPQLRKKLHHSSWQFVTLTVLLFVALASHLSIETLKSYSLGETEFSSHTSITRRVRLNQAGLEMFISQPILGVGLNHFTAEVERYSKVRETVRFVQPAHHFAVLFLAENGLFGVLTLMVLVILLSSATERNVLLQLGILFSPILFLDHYLYTLAQGHWLIGIAWFSLSIFSSNE